MALCMSGRPRKHPRASGCPRALDERTGLSGPPRPRVGGLPRTGRKALCLAGGWCLMRASVPALPPLPTRTHTAQELRLAVIHASD